MNYTSSLRTPTLPTVTTKNGKFKGSQRPAGNGKAPHQSTPVIAQPANQILASLPKTLLDEIKPNLRRAFLRKDSYVYQQDDLLNTIYFPETAVLSELHILDDGRMVEVSMTGSEGALGIGALFAVSHIPNCVQTSQSGTVLKIEVPLLQKILVRHAELKDHLCEPFAGYIRQLSQRAVCNMYHSVKERFCTWLMMMNDRCDQSTLKLTHEQIARALGVYRPSVTCIALEMREHGVIDYSRGGVRIIDRHVIEEQACSCYLDLTAGH